MVFTTDIDTEWENFISQKYDDELSSDNDENDENDENEQEGIISADLSSELSYNHPISSDIYISTKTKISYLNSNIDLKKIFWDVPIIPYYKPCNGVVKKQMKFNSFTSDELLCVQEKLKGENYFEEHIITHIDNPSGRIKFKDTRKISIGVSKKDLLSYRCKKKSAFYNCFVLIMRMKVKNIFKEFHVKVFNTGKLEIPGVQEENIFILVLNQLLETLQPYVKEKLEYNETNIETVLINSNFNCGFFINRETLYDMLRVKYNIQAIYDPCSYPGIQCKFYYNPDIEIQNGCQISEENKKIYKNIKDISFMIFRTGSVLIVGKCDEHELISIYNFIKNILSIEYKNICQKNIKSGNDEEILVKIKKTKIRRKNIIIETSL